MARQAAKLRFPKAALKVREGVKTATPVFASAEDVVAAMGAEKPIHCLYPQVLERQAKFFLEHFPGRTLYAVKCNPDRDVLRYLHAFGVRDFEVASRNEIDLVLATVGSARLYFMHPVKARGAIRHAYARGVRDFAFDCRDELMKIAGETGRAADLGLHLRIRVGNEEAALNLSSKFGAEADEAAALLKEARGMARRLGVCFHVGSQCTAPGAFRKALHRAAKIIAAAGVTIDVLDVGGGFPGPYPGFTTPQLPRFFDAIRKAIADFGLSAPALWCEPGRALVTEAGSVLARVELRKGDWLYLNDGTYGSLFDAGRLSWRYPTRLVRPGGEAAKTLKPFHFFGPTCDGLDAMPGPFLLPADVREGDWIEIQNLGGYGLSMRTAFNGFTTDLSAIVEGPRGAAKRFKLQAVKA